MAQCEKKCFLPSEALSDENVKGLYFDESDTSQFGDPVNLFYVQFLKQIDSVIRGQNVWNKPYSCGICMFEMGQIIVFLVNSHHLFA